MEFRYIALLWSPGHELQSLQASRLITKIQRSGPGWHQAVARDGLAVFTRISHQPAPRPRFLKTYPLAGQCGLVLGTLFRRDGGSAVPLREIAGNSGFAEACLASRGAHLTSNFWGAYVAFLSDPRTGDWSILRDCSGMLPCYYTTLHGVTMAFSDARDLQIQANGEHRDGPIIPFEVNWRYITGFLAASQMQIRETGLKDIYELLAGESLESAAGRRTVRFLWDPVSIAETDPCHDGEDTCRELRDTTFSCIEAWAGVHHSLLHSLSGGFDSSLVLSLLTRTAKRPKVMCVNRFASGPAQDDRRYAHMAAEAARVKLEELPWDGEQALDDFCMETPRTVKPTLPQVFAGMDAESIDLLAWAQDAEVTWTGQGGDHLFMAIQTGMGVPAPRTDLLAADALLEDLETYICHPWAAASAALPPEKRLQVIYLAEALNGLRPHYGVQKLQELHPLLSQPLIELCLRIPIYHLLKGGKPRGLARVAFRGDLPAAILDREQKGQTTHHVLALLHNNRKFLAEALLDGHVIRQGLVDREALRSVLRSGAPIGVPALLPLLTCVAAEVWLENWHSPTLVAQCTGQSDGLAFPAPTKP